MIVLTLLEINPDSVRAGWLPLLIIIGVGVIVALLGWSMLHEIKKVKVPTKAEVLAQAAATEAPAGTDADSARVAKD